MKINPYVMKDPQFRRIFIAESISTLGDNIAPVAIAFAVLGTDHSALGLGLVLAARSLPMAAFVLLGGVWADRLPRKTLMVASDLTRLISQGAFAIILLLPAPALWALMALQAVNGTAAALYRPASSGLLQEAIPPQHRQTANGLLSATNNISTIAGPAIAALLILAFGNAWAVGADALSFGVSALFLMGVRVPARVVVPRQGALREIGEGLRAVLDRKWLALEITAFAQFQVFVLATYAVLGPLIADQEYGGAASWALIASAGGVGALVADLISLKWRPTRPLVAANCVNLLCMPLLVALAAQAPFFLLVGCGFLFGIGLSLPDTLWFTAMQNNVPGHLMSRVSSFDWMGSMVLRPLGLAALAPLAVLFTPAAILITSAAVTVLTLAGITSTSSVRSLRSLSSQPRVGEQA